MMHYHQRQSSIVSLSSSPVLLSVFAWSVTLLLMSSCLGIVDAEGLISHRLGKRSFALQCKGNWNASSFAKLNRICDDCYNMYNAAQVYTLCMQDCFTSNYFRTCVEALLMEDKLPEIKEAIVQLHGADPTIN